MVIVPLSFADAIPPRGQAREGNPRVPRPLRGRWRGVLLLLLLPAVLLGLGACGRQPEAPTLPPLLYRPPGEELLVQWDELIHFEVTTVYGIPVPVTFYLDGDSITTAPALDWTVDRAGPTFFTAVARLDGRMTTHQWVARIDSTRLQPVGAVRQAEVYRVPVEGALGYQWLRPDRAWGQPEMDRYELAVAVDSLAIFDPVRCDLYTVSHRQGVDCYRCTVDDLPPGQPVFARVRAIDQVQRPGPWSPLLRAIPSARFDREGRILLGDDSCTIFQPLAQVQLQAQDQTVLTGADGVYRFEGLLDYLPSPLTIAPPASAPPLYSLSPTIESPHDRAVDYLLIPTRSVQLLLPEPEEWSFLRFLKTLTAMDGGNCTIAHWEHYPVRVQRIDRVSPNGVDYGSALERAVQLWNEAAGRTLLETVAFAPAEGVVTSCELPLQGGAALGKVSVLEPLGAELYHTIPVLLHLALAEDFDSQSLADRVLLHELGHVLYLTHSPSVDHVMSAGVCSTSPNAIHPDEAAVLRVLVELPNGTRMDWYEDEDGPWWNADYAVPSRSYR